MRMVIVDPTPPELRFAEMDSGKLRPITCPMSAAHADDLFDPERLSSPPEVCVSILHHGGDEFDRAVEEIDDDVISRMERVVPKSPDYNTMTLSAVRAGRRAYPNARHLLLCETGALFGMPLEASSYAVPPSLRKLGVQRYGARGLSHFWADREIAALGRKGHRKVITIMIAPSTTVAAFDDGRPVETSAGFSPVEGIPSMTASGEIDPTIVLHLRALGLRIEDVNQQLTERAGLQALAGEALSLGRLLGSAASPRIKLARDVYTYHTVRQIGGHIAALGGVDAIAFFGNSGEKPFRLFVSKVSEKLSACLPLQLRSESESQGAHGELTTDESAVTIYHWACSRWDRLAKISASALQGGLTHA